MKIFITYSSSEGTTNSNWVGNLADDLERHDDFDVTIDQYDLDTYMDKNLFMEHGVTNSDVIIVVATSEYKHKADNRRRGVGIESQLAAQRHYQESGEVGSSNIIVVLREPDSIPTYLLSKIYIDFTNDASYQKSFNELARSLRKQPARKRPAKLVGTNDIGFSNLTRIEDVLKIIYRKRSVVIGLDEGRDKSAGNKIKFELWEVQAPKREHILVLYDHIAVGQTIERALDEINRRRLSVPSITVIRVDDRVTVNLEEQVKKGLPHTNLSEFTLKGFLREFCVDSDLAVDATVWQEPFFIDQPIYASGFDESSKLADQAIPYLLSAIESPTKCSALLILAEGGDGKSSLCSSLVNAIIGNKQTSAPKKGILLRVDRIREKIGIDVSSNFRIATVYDVYNLFSTLIATGEGVESYPRISKNEFEVSVFCGNLVVVIDGLDELHSVFQDRFDKDSFLASIRSLNDQLGESSIILTSRGNIFLENFGNLDDIQVCFLKGFDETECERYFHKRFYKDTEAARIKKKCLANVGALIEETKVHRVSPFVVDLIASINGQQDGADDDDYSLAGKPYQSNNSFKDKVVYHVLRREIRRQEVHISMEDLVDLFCEIAADHGPSISLSKLRELVDIYYENRANSVYEYLKINPLLQVRDGGSAVAFRYNFLQEYFLVLFVIHGVLKQSITQSHIAAFGRYAEGASVVGAPTGYQDVVRYFRDHRDTADCCQVAKKLTNTYKDKAKQLKQIERAISFLVHLKIDLHGDGISRKELSEELFSCFGGQATSDLVQYLFIYGNTSSLDFSGRRFAHCGFYRYLSFFDSNLDHSFFSYTTVEIETEGLGACCLTKDTFDTTCKIGRLGRFFGNINLGDSGGEASHEESLRRFFWNFLEGNSFVEKKTADLVFPLASQSTRSGFFREAVSQHILCLSNDGEKCGLSKQGKQIVNNYLMNNVLEGKIYKVLQKM